jgi:hypothetical protein
MTLQKVIDALTKIQNSEDPDSSYLKNNIEKVEIHFADFITFTIKDRKLTGEE